MWNRWQDPETGRFISEDPARDGENWYAYVGSNPLTNVDPTGLILLHGSDGNTYDTGSATSDPVYVTPKSHGGPGTGGTVVLPVNVAVPSNAISWWTMPSGRTAVVLGDPRPQSPTDAGTVAGDESRKLPDVIGDFKSGMSTWWDQTQQIGRKISSGDYGGAVADITGVHSWDDFTNRYLDPLAGGSGGLFGTAVKAETKAYESLFDATIQGTSRSAHRLLANKQLYQELLKNPDLRKELDELLGEDVLKYMRSGRSQLKNPPGTEWHHPISDSDIVQLLQKYVHRDPALQDVLHPDDVGGFFTFFGGK